MYAPSCIPGVNIGEKRGFAIRIFFDGLVSTQSNPHNWHAHALSFIMLNVNFTNKEYLPVIYAVHDKEICHIYKGDGMQDCALGIYEGLFY